MSAFQQLKELYEASTINGRKVATFDTTVFIDSGICAHVCQACGFNGETDPDNIRLIAAALNALPALVRVAEAAPHLLRAYEHLRLDPRKRQRLPAHHDALLLEMREALRILEDNA